MILFLTSFCPTVILLLLERYHCIKHSSNLIGIMLLTFYCLTVIIHFTVSNWQTRFNLIGILIWTNFIPNVILLFTKFCLSVIMLFSLCISLYQTSFNIIEISLLTISYLVMIWFYMADAPDQCIVSLCVNWSRQNTNHYPWDPRF